mmetsp:Transcript_2503/g.4309  ORF Transcript_2503/g.4309 Transcript_2503/m.4309 type:complete len:477 (+) Transcript_2503:66-1496(+)
MNFSPEKRNGTQSSGSTAPASEPFIIGIAGGTASGKTTVCQRITQRLGGQHVVLLSLDEFYRDLTAEECANIADVDFDAPDAFDIGTLCDCLDVLLRGYAADVPVYDFTTSKRSETKTRHVSPADVVVLEGILVLHFPEVLRRCNMKVFVDTDDDVRLARRIQRDTVERGRDVSSVITQYTRFVKPAFEKYILPSKLCADIIVPWKAENKVAVDLITEHIKTKLAQQDLRRIYPNLTLLESTSATRGMHTLIRSRTISREDFVFYADRLIRLVVEKALGELPFVEVTVETPIGEPYAGVSYTKKICGVSIIRSGESMETALRACCKGIRIGKILIHRTKDQGTEIGYEKLPHDISQRHVLLMDPILATGSSVLRACELLIKHRGVDEEKIVLLSLIAAPEGIHAVFKRYPRAKVITTEIDAGLDADKSVKPGVGDFGDRYFGTSNACEDRLTSSLPSGSAIALDGSTDAGSNSPPR